ncbi:putative siderophore-interacting protein [Actinoplanes missouriensis 431]|uniref:Putative siderophore-interacting protein n=1 Tax=Actinoplanes missouriensis (strain ATCC 14538 / DSM 43046 / CBS 188.64 / JCM 3121 / NBRC 102363 / NCIMB 12654 / NRRL B-3342 / UNCC 431) TaxID=512565 RepID=I0HFT5_ACTM4|nr:siderophore-interacting protein [Actinoplanes missouriensis]BAL91872.1 putative siderophore-interacting protein [Actinoplanes missouriensis 431]
MANRPARPAHQGVVTRVEQLTPHMVRVVVGGDVLTRIEAGQFTDHYIKVLFPQPGVDYPEPFEMGVIRETMPRDTWPVVRTYTVRKWLPEIPEMWVDFVVHGDSGIAGPWAAHAKPGDPFRFMGPGGGYTPSTDADWHLLAGDESALPAIAATLEGMPEGARVRAFLEVEGPDEEQKLPTPADADITWLHRGARPVGSLLCPAVRGAALPEGRGQAFVHGEANFVRDLRGYLRLERGMTLDQLSISGYWRNGMNEDGWQSSKRDFNEQTEREQEKAAV